MNEQPTDEQLRKIARDANPVTEYSGGVRALRAVWNEAFRTMKQVARDEVAQDIVANLTKGIAR